MAVSRETQWSREYKNKDGGDCFLDSRFRDGSASITLVQLKHDWTDWQDHEKIDFAQSFVHYRGRHRTKILRFLIVNGDHNVWSAIAASVAISLSAEESVPFLSGCSETCDIGRGANYFQALSLTGSPEAVNVLRPCLERIWESPDLLEAEPFCNFTAFDAIWCIDALFRLGEPLDSLRDRYETLKTHPSMGEDVMKWLSGHFEQRKA